MRLEEISDVGKNGADAKKEWMTRSIESEYACN